jgi:hypothetical protein
VVRHLLLGASFTPIARRAMDEGASARAMVASGCLENRWHGGMTAKPSRVVWS